MFAFHSLFRCDNPALPDRLPCPVLPPSFLFITRTWKSPWTAFFLLKGVFCRMSFCCRAFSPALRSHGPDTPLPHPNPLSCPYCCLITTAFRPLLDLSFVSPALTFHTASVVPPS